MHALLLRSLIPITPRLRDTTSLARTGRASTRWRGYNRSFRGATGTFCNCQRANLSDERVLHAASRPHTTPAIIISYTIVSRSPRGGGGVAGASRGESNGRNLYPTPAFQGNRCTVWIREFTHVRPIHAPTHASWLRFFGGDDLRYIRGNIERVAKGGGGGGGCVEFDGFWRRGDVQRLLLIALESKRVEEKVFNFASNSIQHWIEHRIDFKSEIYDIF